VLERAGDALRFRYLAGSARAGGVSPVRPPQSATDTPITFTLVTENASRFGEPFSPTHQLRATRDRDRLTVRPAQNLSGSFDVFLPLAGADVGIALATHRVNGEDGYFMLTLSPGAVKAAAAPRDLAVVVDVSGSMSGEKIEQARQALHQLLGTLSARDRFRLVSFGNRVEAHRPAWTEATRANLDDGRAWVDRLAATGGTNIAGALDEAFRTPAGEGRLHHVVFITDGLPTTGETDPDRIAARVEAARGQARIFTFGVGYDLNTYLLERMAVAGRGTVDYVEPGRNVEEAVGSLANRIQHPVLVDLAFSGSPVRLKDMQPSRLPDLYAGQELVVLGRYESTERAAAGDLSIAGTRSGRVERFGARVDFPLHSTSGAYIPGLWAARKVGDLMRTIRVEGSTPERVAEVRELALRYGLVTEYTSYLVQEPPRVDVQNARISSVVGQARGGVGGGGGGGANSVAAAPPVAISGEAAVEAAKVASTRRQLGTVFDLAHAERVMADGMMINGRADARIVSGRTFRLEAGVWIDAGHTAQARVVHLEPFGAAYFAVLAKLPELKPYWSAFDAVTVSGRQVSIRVAPGGVAAMTATDVDALVRDFRTQ
jgi:Ca-activated chloride channel family protein